MKNYLFILFIFYVLSSKAQTPFNVADLNGNVYRSRSGANVSGHPFLLENYAKGTIVMIDGRKDENLEIKYDLIADVIIYKDDKGREIEITDPIALFTIADYSENGVVKNRVFRSGFLDWGLNNDRSFYEILHHQKEVIFAKKIRKTIVENTEYSSAVITKNILSKETFFIIIDHQPQAISKTEKSIAQALALDQKKLKEFLAKQKLSIKKDEAIILILKNLNELK